MWHLQQTWEVCGKNCESIWQFLCESHFESKTVIHLDAHPAPLSFQPLFPEIGTTLCTSCCCKHLPGGSARPLARQLQGSDVIWWRGCLVRRQEKGRVKNNLKTTNPALLGCRPKMDLSLKWTNHVSHLYQREQASHFTVIPVSVHNLCFSLTKHQLASCKTCRNHVTKATSSH